MASRSSCVSCVPKLQPVMVSEVQPSDPLIFSSPFITPLVFENVASDARDHCANERNFLSWLRLSIYLAVVSIAIIVNFSLKATPSQQEKQMSIPLGAIFWLLSLLCLGTGLGIYFSTVSKYGRRKAVVEHGGKTRAVFFVVSATIIGTCVILITTNARQK